jgi:excisionase family DNA binding protein
MTTNQPLTLTVEQAAEVLGVGRSTAYELARSGDLKCIRLRRRIVVPVAHLAESLGVDRDTVWDVLNTEAMQPPSRPRGAASKPMPARRRPKMAEPSTLF